ncbi:unnamed protein product [Hymenolepis diminuta]|uniref:Uncharacterized protein n=1 Tax=Hymenolepis diminuta TaxID=6216 RepID=A0A564Z6D6_HYMDI|nr:unnamed protein product [Hymenolepis diminuta]
MNKDFDRSNFKSISNSPFKYLSFLGGGRNSCYSDVYVRFLNMMEQNHDIPL